MNTINLILRDIAELDYEGFDGTTMMMVTPNDLKLILERHIAERTSSAGSAVVMSDEQIAEKSLAAPTVAGAVLSDEHRQTLEQIEHFLDNSIQYRHDEEGYSPATEFDYELGLRVGEIRAILAAAAPLYAAAQALPSKSEEK